jgi:hypothetical protein
MRGHNEVTKGKAELSMRGHNVNEVTKAELHTCTCSLSNIVPANNTFKAIV